jgi:biopolymer transport protein TolR
MGGAAIADSGGSRGKRALDATLNLVPFIDLLCSLISFLLMTAVWTQVARLELKQGNAGPIFDATPQVDLRVEVHEKGFTIVENNRTEIPIPRLATAFLGSDYDYLALAARLTEERHKYAGNKTLVVVVADNVRYSELIRVMDTAITAGLDGLSVSGTAL